MSIACVECDLLLELGELQSGDRAACPRCGHLLTSRSADGLTRSLAFALAAAVLFALANAYPFLALKASGLENVMNLPRATLEIYREGYQAMALLVGAVILVIPALLVAILIALLLTLRSATQAEWLVPAGRVFFRLTPWAMVEVFVIGVVVSLVKIGHMATVVLGISFWAYVAFSLCFTAALASLDRLEVWDEIERCTP